ncbi:MAG: hypothetical protein ACO3L6_08080 [Dehalococcoidia bacterium]
MQGKAVSFGIYCYILVVGADRAKTAVFPSGPAPVTEGIDQYMA